MASYVEGGGVLLKQVMLAKALQPENAAFPIEPMPSGKSIFVRAMHFLLDLCLLPLLIGRPLPMAKPSCKKWVFKRLLNGV